MTKKTRNKFEARLDKQLKSSGVNYEYETERIPYIVKGNYIPDFPISTSSGKKFYIEGKGHFRREDKVKLRAVKTCHPEIDIRIVFSGYSTANSKWAKKYGFPYSIGIIPEEWLL